MIPPRLPRADLLALLLHVAQPPSGAVEIWTTAGERRSPLGPLSEQAERRVSDPAVLTAELAARRRRLARGRTAAAQAPLLQLVMFRA